MANRRKRYLVNKKMQLQFAWLLTMQTLVPIIMLGGSLYVVNKMYLLTLQKILGNNITIDRDIQSVLNFSVSSLIALLVITFILLIFMGIRFSHNIAGPLYKLKMCMDRLASGEKVEPITFRKTDIIGDIDRSFNRILERVNQGKR